MARVRIPRREKLQEKEKLSAIYPIPSGKAPPPRRKLTMMTSDTARFREDWRNTVESMVKPLGNVHAADEA